MMHLEKNEVKSVGYRDPYTPKDFVNALSRGITGLMASGELDPIVCSKYRSSLSH